MTASFSRISYEHYLYSLPETTTENEALRATFPHHRHEPPDIKHNRQPAPGISFQMPNLPRLIEDCIEMGAALLDGTDS